MSDDSAVKAASYTLEQLNIEITMLESILSRLGSPAVLCHCDLLSANLIHDDEQDEINFIDYEYSSVSYRGFDIGNHFAEYAGFECDYSRYPSEDAQRLFLIAYLRCLGVSEAEVQMQMDDLVREVNLFALASHIYWALWALIQASVSDIDFDYATYASLRLQEYRRLKAELIGGGGS